MSFGPAIFSRLGGTLPRLTCDEIKDEFKRANLSNENVLPLYRYLSCFPVTTFDLVLRWFCDVESVFFQSILSKIVGSTGVVAISAEMGIDNASNMLETATGLMTFLPKNENVLIPTFPAPVPGALTELIPPHDPPHGCPPHCPCGSPGG